MFRADDFLTDWPALDVAATRARLQHSVHISPRLLADAFAAATDTFVTLEVAQAIAS